MELPPGDTDFWWASNDWSPCFSFSARSLCNLNKKKCVIQDKTIIHATRHVSLINNLPLFQECRPRYFDSNNNC